jgi:heme A synthase
MSPSDSPRIRALRMLMALDGTVLTVLGIAFLCCPHQIEEAFHFKDISPSVNFLTGLWGCALVSLGVGYFVAAINPVEHRLWVTIGVLRGGLEALFGWWCLSRGIVTWKQSGLTILLAAAMALAYIALYPRQTRDDSWKLPH